MSFELQIIEDINRILQSEKYDLEEVDRERLIVIRELAKARIEKEMKKDGLGKLVKTVKDFFT